MQTTRTLRGLVEDLFSNRYYLKVAGEPLKEIARRIRTEGVVEKEHVTGPLLQAMGHLAAWSLLSDLFEDFLPGVLAGILDVSLALLEAHGKDTAVLSKSSLELLQTQATLIGRMYGDRFPDVVVQTGIVSAAFAAFLVD